LFSFIVWLLFETWCGIDNQQELAILIDASRNVLVIFNEFLFGHFNIIFRCSQQMMSLKCFQIFTKHILLSSLTIQHIWVIFGIITSFNYIDINNSGSILIHFVKGFFDSGHSGVGDFSSDFVKEFVIVKSSIFVVIEYIKQNWDVLFTNTNFEILACFCEFS
jgi:hypothetical protein